jgi:hypothetical protein
MGELIKLRNKTGKCLNANARNCLEKKNTGNGGTAKCGGTEIVPAAFFAKNFGEKIIGSKKRKNAVCTHCRSLTLGLLIFDIKGIFPKFEPTSKRAVGLEGIFECY